MLHHVPLCFGNPWLTLLCDVQSRNPCMKQAPWRLQECLRFPFLKQSIMRRPFLQRENGFENLDFAHGLVEPNLGGFLESPLVFWIV